MSTFLALQSSASLRDRQASGSWREAHVSVSLYSRVCVCVPRNELTRLALDMYIIIIIHLI